MKPFYLCLLILVPAILTTGGGAVSETALHTHGSGIWSIAGTADRDRWIVIHNLEEGVRTGIYHIEVLARKKSDPPGKLIHLKPHMAITEAALLRSIVKPLKSGAVYPETYDDAYREWTLQQKKKQAEICETSVVDCLEGTRKTVVHPVDGSVMVWVPGGPFIMGTDTGWAEAGPQHTETVAGFYIDKYEISIDMFRRFVDAGGYADPRYWPTDQGKLRFGKPDFGPPHWKKLTKMDGSTAMHYVRYIDALAYCLWAHKTLPTATQWEKAARGIDGRNYPWGDDWDPERADVLPIERFRAGQGPVRAIPSAVDAYPGGESPYGVRQMAGNVWEWVLGSMKAYPQNTHPYRFYPSFKTVFFPELRGGSRTLDARFATTTFRTFNYEQFGNASYGFRCACERLSGDDDPEDAEEAGAEVSP